MNRLSGERVKFFILPAFLILLGLGIVLRLADAAGSGLESGFSDPIPLTAVGQAGGITWKIQEQDGYLYTGMGSRLYVLDATSPNTPTVVGRSEPLGAYIPSLVVSGSHVYLADGIEGLRVVDISDPTQPVEVGNLLSIGFVWGIDVAGHYAYLSSFTNLYIADITDPTNPVLIGTGSCCYGGRDLKVAGNYAYIHAQLDGFHIMDVSNPANPSWVSTSPGTISLWGVEVIGNHVYLAQGSGLQVLDVTNPAVPVQVGVYDATFGVDGLDLFGDYAYLTGAVNEIVDISDPTSIEPVSTIESPYGIDVVVGNSRAYLVTWPGILAIDVTSPTVPTEVGYYLFDFPYSPYALGLGDGYAYVADNNYACYCQATFGVFSLVDPSMPVQVGNTVTFLVDDPTIDPAGGMAVDGDYAYLPNGSLGLYIFDISDPLNAAYLTNYSPGSTRDVAITGTYAYLANSNNLRVLDVSNPALPTFITSRTTHGSVKGVELVGNFAYLADGGAGLQIYNIINPAAPVFSGTVNTPGLAWDVAVSGQYAYVADGPGGLRVIDVSNPSLPVEVGYEDSFTALYKVVVRGNTVYATSAESSYSPVVVYDVSNPSAPVVIDYHMFSWTSDGLALGDEHLYVVNQVAGLTTFGEPGIPSTPTSTSTAAPSDTPTSTSTPTNTPTPTPSNTPTATPSHTPTPTNTTTNTSTPTPTNTPAPTNTLTPIPSNTPTATPSYTPTPTPSITPTETSTSTSTPTTIPTPVPSPTATATTPPQIEFRLYLPMVIRQSP